jgi:hypothetical protein
MKDWPFWNVRWLVHVLSLRPRNAAVPRIFFCKFGPQCQVISQGGGDIWSTKKQNIVKSISQMTDLFATGTRPAPHLEISGVATVFLAKPADSVGNQ